MLDRSLFYGGIVGLAYLLAIMWWLTGHTPMDLINAMADIISQPFETLNITLG